MPPEEMSLHDVADSLEGLFDDDPVYGGPEPDGGPIDEDLDEDAHEADDEAEDEEDAEEEDEDEASEDGQKYLTFVGKDGKAHRMHIDQFLGNTQHTVKVNGEVMTVGYDDLLGGYQRQADYTRSKQEVAAEKAALARYKDVVAQLESDDRFGTYIGAYFESGGVDPAVLQAAMPEVTEGQLADALSSGKPEMVEAAKNVLKARAVAREQHESWTKATEAASAKRMEFHEAFITKEHEQLVSKASDFKDHAKSVMGSLVEKYGFSEAEVKALADHRILHMAYDLVKGTNPPKPDKPAKAPVTRGAAMGTNRVASRGGAKQVQARYDKATKTQSVEDWANVLDGLF